jgi:hypothetical protein
MKCTIKTETFTIIDHKVKDTGVMGNEGIVVVETDDGDMIIKEDHMILKDASGRIFTVHKDEFDKKYDVAKEDK